MHISEVKCSHGGLSIVSSRRWNGLGKQPVSCCTNGDLRFHATVGGICCRWNEVKALSRGDQFGSQCVMVMVSYYRSDCISVTFTRRLHRTGFIY